MEFDQLLTVIGEIGCYQRVTFCLIGALQVIFSSVTMGIVFLAGVPDHWCASPSLARSNLSSDAIKNLTIPLEDNSGVTTYSQCKMYDYNYSDWEIDNIERTLADPLRINYSTSACRDGWTYDTSIYTSTIVSQWDLVCEYRWLQATQTLVYAGGLMAGILVFGTLADILGRKPGIILAMVPFVISTVAVAFSPNFITFTVLRFFLGAGVYGMYTSGFVLMMEVVGVKYRAHLGMAIMYFWSAGYMLIALVAYFIRDWFVLQLVSGLPTILLAATVFMLDESPRWLFAQNKHTKAEAVVRKMASKNKSLLPEPLDVVVKNQRKGFVFDLFRTPRLRWRSFNLMFNWFVNCAVYYGLSLNTSNLGGNHFLNFFISAAVETVAYIASQISLAYIQRRIFMTVAMILGGLSLLCVMAVPEEKFWIAVVLSMFGKFWISGSFAAIYIVTTEVYPTNNRSVGLAACAIWARIGGMAAPFIAQLSDFSSYIPLAIFGALSLAAGLLALLLPETKDANLPETIDDADNFGSVKPPPEYTQVKETDI